MQFLERDIPIDVLLLGESILPESKHGSSGEENDSSVYESEESESESEDNETEVTNEKQVVAANVNKTLEMICVDPVTLLHYRLCMSSNNLIIEPTIPKDVETDIREKVKKHRIIIKNLTKLDGFVWLLNKGEADQYRRRKLPQYLIAREVSDYPSYIFQSELSKAFNSISHITLRVNLMEYQSSIKNKKKARDLSELYVEIKESLVTSSKETIKNVLHEVKK